MRIVKISTTHSFFDELVTLVISLAAANAAITSYLNRGRISETSNRNHSLHLYGTFATYSFPTYELMHGIAGDQWPVTLTMIQAASGKASPTYPDNHDLNNVGLQKLIIGLIGSAFLRCYEGVSNMIKARHGNQPKEWPSLWRFAWLLRNAIAHGNMFAINDQTFPISTWKTIKITPAHSGHQWFDLDAGMLGGGDVVLLLEEMAASLHSPNPDALRDFAE